MPLPVVPIGIIWIIGAAAAFGILSGILAFFMSKEGTVAALVVLIVFVGVLLIPFLPDNFRLVRYIKRKIRHVLREDSNNADLSE